MHIYIYIHIYMYMVCCYCYWYCYCYCCCYCYFCCYCGMSGETLLAKLEGVSLDCESNRSEAERHARPGLCIMQSAHRIKGILHIYIYMYIYIYIHSCSYILISLFIYMYTIHISVYIDHNVILPKNNNCHIEKNTVTIFM